MRSVQVASQIPEVIHGHSHQHENVPQSQERDKAQPRVVTPECADAIHVSEHCMSTPCTRTQRLTINRLVSKCRTRQPESCDTLPAFLRVWTELPTDLRLHDGRLWQPVKPLLLLSPGANVTWSSGSVHMMTDAKRVEKPGRSL